MTRTHTRVILNFYRYVPLITPLIGLKIIEPPTIWLIKWQLFFGTSIAIDRSYIRKSLRVGLEFK